MRQSIHILLGLFPLLFSAELLAQSSILLSAESHLPISLSWREDLLGIEHTQIDMPEHIQSERGAEPFRLSTEGTRRLLVQVGDESKLILIRPGYDYHITAGDSAIDLRSEDPFHDAYDAALSIWNGYTLYKISDDSLLLRLDEIQARYDSIVAMHPGDDYLAAALDYFLARMSISPCIQSSRGLEVQAYIAGLEERLVRRAPFRPDHPFYTYFLQIYYRWKPNIVAFAKSELPRSASNIDRLHEAFEMLDNDSAAQMALVYIAHDRYKGEGSRDAEFYRHAIDSIAETALHPLTEKMARKVLGNMDRLSRGLMVGDYKFTDSNGNAFELSDINSDRYVLLDFWFVGCKPCLRDVPELKALHTEFAERLTVVGVNPLQGLEKLSPYGQKYDIPYLLAVPEAPAEIKKEFNVNGYPTYVLLAPGGRADLFAGSKLELVRSHLQGLGESPQKASPMKR